MECSLAHVYELYIWCMDCIASYLILYKINALLTFLCFYDYIFLPLYLCQHVFHNLKKFDMLKIKSLEWITIIVVDSKIFQFGLILNMNIFQWLIEFDQFKLIKSS
jgi:hypothetical protein